MSVSREEIERRRRLAQQAADEVDPSEIEGLAPPPSTPQPSQKLETQQPDRKQTAQFGPSGTVTEFNIDPPPQRDPDGLRRIADEVNRDMDPNRAAEVRAGMEAIRDQVNKEYADANAGRLETAASEFGEAAVGMATSAAEGVIRGVIAERQGRGIANRLGLQPLANKLLGRELTDDELTRILPEIENNPVSKWLDKNLDFNLGSNPEYLSNPDEDFEIGKFLNSTVPAALGSMSTFVLAGLVTKGASAAAGAGPLASSIAGGVTASGLGAVTGGSGTAEGVAAKGGTNEQVIDAFVRGNLPGLTEGFPISRALNRLDRGSGGQLSRILKEGFKGSVEEAIQETIQGASTKAIENALLDLDQDLFDRETKEGTAAGAVAGFLTSSLLTALGGRRRGQNRTGPAERASQEAGGQPPPEQPQAPPEAAPEPAAQPEAEAQPAPEPAPEVEPSPERGDMEASAMFGAPESDEGLSPVELDQPEPEPSTAIPETYEGPDGRIYPVGTQLEGESDEAFAARLGYEAQQGFGQEAAPEPAPAPEAAPEAQPEPEAAPEPQAAPETPEPAPEALPAPEPEGPDLDADGVPMNRSGTRAEWEAQQGLPTKRDEDWPVDTIEPETAAQTVEAVNRLLPLGAQVDSDGGPQSIVHIPALPGRDLYSDNETDHDEALIEFMRQADAAGWQVAGNSENSKRFGMVTPNGDRVGVYKMGAGMPYAVEMRPSDKKWEKMTALKGPNIDQNLAANVPPQTDPWRGGTPGEMGAQSIIDTLPERNEYLQSAISGLEAAPDLRTSLEQLESNPESIDPLSPEGQYLSAQGVLRSNQYKGSTTAAGLSALGTDVLNRMRQADPAAPMPVPEGVPEPDATTGEMPSGASPVQPQGTQEGRHTVQTAGGQRVETQFAVMPSDLLVTSDKEGFTEALQPRERRSRQASEDQINDIIKNFDPRQIAGADPTAAAGSPIVNDRGEVISGNGRVAALRRIFETRPDLAEQYATYVRDQLGVDIQAGEILVQAVATPQDAAAQRAFVDQANVAAQAEFSRAEQARTDARAIDEAMIAQLQPTDLTNLGNQDFVRAFVSALQQRGVKMNKVIQNNGILSAEGRQRIEAALVARALGATDAQSESLTRTLEDPDDNTKNVTNAILDAAKDLAGLQIAAEQGNVAPEIAGQVAPAMSQAIETVSMLRRSNRNVEEFLRQVDLEGPRPALVDEFIKSFYNPTLSRPTSRGNMAAIFQKFAQALTRQADLQQGDLLGAAPQAVDPAAILRQAREAVQGSQAAPTQSGLFGPGGNPFGGGAAPQTPPATPQSSPEGGGQAAANLPVPAQPAGATQVARSKDFETDGTYDVTLPSGKQVQIFRDTDQFSSPVWHLVDDGNTLQIGQQLRDLIKTQGIGSTQREAISFLERQDQESGGPNVQSQSDTAAPDAAGMATATQQTGQGSTSGSALANAGNVAPSAGIPTEGNQQDATTEKQSAPGLVNPGSQNNVANQKKVSYEQRESPQFDEKAAILGNDIVEKLEKGAVLNESLPETHPNVSTLAIGINKDMIRNRSTQFIGKTIQTIKDFAELAQIYRDPQYETLRYVFLDKDNKVIFQTGVSSRLPGSAASYPEGVHGGQWVQELFDRMQDAGATKLILQHNHPSGKAKPSSNDIKMTKNLSKLTQRRGWQLKHVIINSNEYTEMNANGSYTTKEAKFFEGDDPLLTPPEGMEHDLLGVKLSNQKLAEAAKWLQAPGKVTLVGLGPRQHVRAIGEMSWDKFKNMPVQQLRKELQSWKIMSGSANLTIVGMPVDTVIFKDVPPLGGRNSGDPYVTSAQMKKLSALGDKLHRQLTRAGIVQDFVDTDGTSAYYYRQFKVPSKKDRTGRKANLNVPQLVYEPTEGPGAQIDSEAVRRQRETVSNVRSGQPLDRLFRWMFTGMGVFEDRWLQTNQAGEDPSFRLGEAALNKLHYFLNDTWFPVDTTDAATENDEEGRAPYAPGRIRNRVYGTFNRLLKRARWGLIDRYGLPDGVRELDERRFQERLETITEGVDAAKKLIEMGADSLEEAKILQGFLIGDISSDQISDKEWASLAEEVRASVDHLGMEAVSLGMISRETYERNKGTWLHRAYYKHESFLSEGDSLQKWIGETLRGSGRGIRGDAFKGRGIFMELEQRQLLKDVPRDIANQLGWGEARTKTTGKPDPMLLQSKWRIFDELVDPNATMTIEGVPDAPSPTRIKRRIYWPADAPVPNSFGNYENRGTFEVRNTRGKKFVLWRDYDAGEREQMGEILDGRYNIIKTFQLLSRDLANARFFKGIAENPEWTWDESMHGQIPKEIVAPKGDKLRDYFDFEWVQVPDTPVSGTAGKVKKWGELGGRFVRAEVWKDISEISEMNSSGPWRRLLTEWKLNKTARNPVVHMNNVMSNLVLMDLLDIRTRDLIEGTMMYMAPAVLRNPSLASLHGMFRRYENPELLAEMRANGAFGHSLVDIELTGEVLNPIAKELREVMGQIAQDSGRNSFMNTARFLNVVSKLWTGQTELYRMEDEVFRTATVIRKLQQGYDMSVSAKMAREQFLNYDIRAPWVNAARRSVMPFISYTYRAVPALTEAIARRPWKLAKYILVAEVANAMAYAVAGGDEEYERGSLREEVQGNISFGVFPGGVPRMIRLPTNDEYGRPEFMDIRRWIPAGDVFDIHNASPIPIPTWMHFSGPLMIMGELVLNRSAFTGQDIVDPLADDLGDKTLKWGNFLFQSFAPSAPYIPESWYWNRIAEAGKREDPVGRTNSRTQAVLQSIGIKVSSQDPELGYIYKQREFEATQRALKGQLNKAARDFQRNIINEAGWRDAQEQYMKKMNQLEQLRQKTFAPYLDYTGTQPPSEFGE